MLSASSRWRCVDVLVTDDPVYSMRWYPGSACIEAPVDLRNLGAEPHCLAQISAAGVREQTGKRIFLDRKQSWRVGFDGCCDVDNM